MTTYSLTILFFALWAMYGIGIWIGQRIERARRSR